MAHMRLLLTVLVGAIWYFAVIDTAAVHSEKFSEHLQRVAEDDPSVGLRAQRSADTMSGEDKPRTCHTTMPCGWAVYTPFTRRIDYFMRNTCTCASSYKCVRTDDDLSVSAYVYRCRNNITATDIVSPEDAN